MLALELKADNTQDGLPLLYPGGHGVRDFQQECQIWTRLTIEHFSTFHLFTDSGFWKYSWAHLVMSMTGSCQ